MLVVLFHEARQFTRPLGILEKVLVHDAEIVETELLFGLQADFKELPSGLEVGRVLLIVKVGCAAEPAGVRAAHTGDQDPEQKHPFCLFK